MFVTQVSSLHLNDHMNNAIVYYRLVVISSMLYKSVLGLRCALTELEILTPTLDMMSCFTIALHSHRRTFEGHKYRLELLTARNNTKC